MVHVYLTYPFVLSWSLLEAMSIECAIVASSTPPVAEAISSRTHGILVDFFDTVELSGNIIMLLKDAVQRQSLGENARARIMDTFDLRRICLPSSVEWCLDF